MKTWLSGIALVAGLLLATSAAHATAYTCNEGGNPPPASVSGDAIISDTATCTLTTDVTASGQISITAGAAINTQNLTSVSNTVISGTDVTTGDITSDWGVQVSAVRGNISVGDVTSNANDSSFGGNVLLTASGNVGTGDITNGGVTTAGGIEIHANTGGTTTQFNVGGGGANGTEVLDVSNSTGGGSNPAFTPSGIYITNGDNASTGGITVNAMSDLMVQDTNSRSGEIILDAKAGALNLPTGNLSADGTTGNLAGNIWIQAQAVTTSNGTVITASQAIGLTGTYHNVVVAAQTINVSGTSGLQIHADGDGVSGSPGSAWAFLVPAGGISVSSTGNLNALYWTTNLVNTFNVNGALTVQGSAPIAVTANGSHSEVGVSAYPISFTNGPVSLQANGNNDNQVQVGYYGTFTGQTGLTFSGTGAATISANGVGGGNGGTVQIYTDQASISTTSFTATANGDNSGGNGGTVTFQPTQAAINSTTLLQANGASAGVGNGGILTIYPGTTSIAGPSFKAQANGGSGSGSNGGTISLNTYPGNLTLDVATKAIVAANASSGGTGDALGAAITFYPGTADFNIGTGEGQWSFAARGGATGGNGGGLFIEGNSSAVTVYGGGTALDVSVPGPMGNGGAINLTTNTVALSGSGISMAADGGSTSGNGGQISVLGNGTISVGSASNTVALSAKAPGSGNSNSNTGGTIEIGYITNLMVDGSALDVSVGGDAAGGIVNLHDLCQLTVTGQLRADGKGSGKGGTVTLGNTCFNTMTLDGSTISASGDPVNGTGNGNQVTINNVAGISASLTNIFANGGGSGDNGGTVDVAVGASASPLDVSTAKLEARGNVNSNTTGSGGKVIINSATGFADGTSSSSVGINVSLNFDVDGGSSSAVTDMGSLTLNSIVCHQWKTAAAIYPLVGWDCIDPAGGSNIPTFVSAGASLSTTLQSQLQDLVSPSPAAPHVSLYAMVSLAQYEQFFGLAASGIYNNQFGISRVSWLRQAATFKQSANGDNATLSGSPTIMVGALVHEIGHNFDYIWGPGLTNYSSQTTWIDLIPLDFATMDGEPCNTVFYAATCSANPGKTNSQIFAIRFPGLFLSDGEVKPYEFFAAMFEHVESVLTGNPPSYMAEPELEKALDTMLRLKATMSSLISSPPTPVK